jgi:hypothetical protein
MTANDSRMTVWNGAFSLSRLAPLLRTRRVVQATLKRMDVKGQVFETYIEGDCSHTGISERCPRTCGVCPDQVGTRAPPGHGHHRALADAEADLYHKNWKAKEETLLQELVSVALGVQVVLAPPCIFH